MRDIKRIHRIISLVEKLWTAYPDTRFNQLMYALQLEYAQENMNYTYVDDGFPDLFYTEDDNFEEFLIKKINEYENKLN